MADRRVALLIAATLIAILASIMSENINRASYYYRGKVRGNKVTMIDMINAGDETFKADMNMVRRTLLVLSLFPWLAEFRCTRTRRKQRWRRPVVSALLMLSLITVLANDIEPNPGPVKDPCMICTKGVRKNQHGIQCDSCDWWCHRKCCNMTVAEYIRLSAPDVPWHCEGCIQCEQSQASADETDVDVTNPDDHDMTTDRGDNFFQELNDLKCKAVNQPIFAFLNINSVRNKFCEIEPALTGGLLDFLAIGETKLDGSFPDQQFTIDNFQMYRKDRNQHGGGLLVYVRSDLPSRRVPELETTQVETLTIELIIEKTKWLLISAYKPPSLSDLCFVDEFSTLLDKVFSLSDNVVVLGDLNFDMLEMTSKNPKPLSDICDIYDLTNLVKETTCHSQGNSSLVDVILTNRSKSFLHTTVIHNSISDVHSMVTTKLKCSIPNRKPRSIRYRCTKNFNKHDFLADLEEAGLEECALVENTNSAWKFLTDKFKSIIDIHAPVKNKRVRANPAPFMNTTLRKEIMKRKRLYHNYLSCRNQSNWELYRRQRNACVSLRRKAIKGYFAEKCGQGPSEGKKFWDTIKPFLSNKGPGSSCDIILCENNQVMNKQTEIVETFNNFFINVAANIGQPESTLDLANHPSILEIQTNSDRNLSFSFEPVTENEIRKIITKLDSKKATGTDCIPTKFVKIACNQITPILTMLINKSIKNSEFPKCLKKAEVTPVYKKSDKLKKENYRPVSILTAFSKIHEKAIENQMVPYLNKTLSPHLSAFRRGYSCQDTLLSLIESWRNDLRANKKVGALLMDLSKAFDCMPHKLLIAKMKAYGMTNQASSLLESYLSDREQRMKIGQTTSSWQNIQKGVPQGSILGPILFNVFINDIFYFIKIGMLTNYADDNTISVCFRSLEQGISTLTDETTVAISWFDNNLMQANPSKFQAIFLGCKEEQISLTVEGKQIAAVDSVKLLGVNLDNKLTFTSHIQELCQKAARQVNVIRRLSKFLDTKSKLAIFRCFILSHFQYCCIIWHHCGKVNNSKLEKLQKRALRYVFEDHKSDYEKLLDMAGLPTLELGREKAIATQTFKILNQISPPYLSDLIKIKTQIKILRSGIMQLDIPLFKRQKFGTYSFTFSAPTIWNSLPENVRTETEFSKFKKEVGRLTWEPK